jgi:hypothetical protein
MEGRRVSDTVEKKTAPLMTPWAADVDPAAPLPEYPRPQMIREEWLNLNGVWQFADAVEGEEPPFGRDLPERIVVPFPVESALSGIMRPAEKVWYRRTFAVPDSWAGRRILLHFGAVDWAARVWVNGTFVGEHRGGYDPFSMDITEALTEGESEIIVHVSDPTMGGQPRGKQHADPHGIWYTSCTGIWQTVWLEPVPETRIASLRMTPDIGEGVLRLTVNVDGPADGLEVVAIVLDDSGVVSKETGEPGREFDATVGGPRLWRPDDPYLYGLKVEIRRDGEVVDSVDSYFGMRDTRVEVVDGVPRLLLNGEPVFQAGLLDQGFWPDGIYTAPTDEALRWDIEQTLALGFNLARKHVKVEPSRWYYWCDVLGLLVWQDMPHGDNQSDAVKSQFETELRAMLAHLHNHPSIVLWVPFNEGWGQFDTARITDMVKSADPSRPVTSASGWTDEGTGDTLDLHHYPQPAAPPPQPRRASILGEFGGLGLPLEGHLWQTEKNWGYQGWTDPEPVTAEFETVWRRAWQYHRDTGLSAAVYTQTTDVESETNGLYTYDRKVLKLNAERVRAAVTGYLPPLSEPAILVPTARDGEILWKYTTEDPGASWTREDLDDTGWTEGPGGFGDTKVPGAVIRTPWETDSIWLRRAFFLDGLDPKDLLFLAFAPEYLEVWINGVQALRSFGYCLDYIELEPNEAARAAVRPGRNTICVHARHRIGERFVDVGLARRPR